MKNIEDLSVIFVPGYWKKMLPTCLHSSLHSYLQAATDENAWPPESNNLDSAKYIPCRPAIGHLPNSLA